MTLVDQLRMILHDVTPNLARELIVSQFPFVPARSIDHLGTDANNVEYLVDDVRIFRFPRRAFAVPFLEAEAALLPLISPRVPATVPVLAYRGEPGETYPWPFAGYDLIAGRTAHGVVLDDDDSLRLACDLGAFLRALHSIDPAAARASGLAVDVTGGMDHAGRSMLLRERFTELEDGGYISDAAPFLRFMERHAHDELQACTIVHGDLYARNLVVDPQLRLRGIIGWGNARLGHPTADLMVAHTTLPVGVHDGFVAAYGDVDGDTWALAKCRAIYHSALVAQRGIFLSDRGLRDSGLAALRLIRSELA